VDIENELERLYLEIAKNRRFQKRHWKWKKEIRSRLQTLWKVSDLTAGELCDGLSVNMDDLAEALDTTWDEMQMRHDQKSCWEQNALAGLPLFIPLRVSGLQEAMEDVEF
jgi:hypothetical protein